MPYKLHYDSQSEKCTYYWDDTNKEWLILAKADHLPKDVKEQIEKDKEIAKLTLEADKYIFSN